MRVRGWVSANPTLTLKTLRYRLMEIQGDRQTDRRKERGDQERESSYLNHSLHAQQEFLERCKGETDRRKKRETIESVFT